jgi:hypothetical protein
VWGLRRSAIDPEQLADAQSDGRDEAEIVGNMPD